MSRKLLFIRVMFVVTLLTVGAVAQKQIETGFLNRSVSFKGAEYRYVVYVPREFSRSQTYPVILALHGGGEYGSDGLKQTNGGLARAVRLNPERFPAIVVFPQTKADGTPGWQQEGGKAALAALDKSIKEFRGDARRVYLTGYSAGGNGSWFLLSHYPERFAAAIVVCGFIFKFKGVTSKVDYPALAPPDTPDEYAYVAKRVSQIPIWIFHGDADQSVSVEESRKMFAALKTEKADVKYTELPGVPHNAWDPAYASAELFEWLLKQKKR
ncbi:MAG: prolyl oligopeptidase family serine peptidase [Pyrinomonadaceae bacterium]|nr:prolyl oligopeptidase family serine peptidase [Pyrinomonadaceae bacterium]